jgi:hypothetical protein
MAARSTRRTRGTAALAVLAAAVSLLASAGAELLDGGGTDVLASPVGSVIQES